MTSPIFYIDGFDQDLSALPLTARLTGDEAHHALNVKRLKVGEGILISDGRGVKLSGVVSEIEDDVLVATLDQVVENVQDFSLVLVQALAKNDRDLLAIEMSTELGITEVVPWEADRSIVRWKGNRAEKAHQKWQNTVRAAAKQARRGLIPGVSPLLKFGALAQQISDWTDSGLKVLILHEDAQLKLSQVLDGAAQAAGYVFVVGPEGGISPQELDFFEKAGAQVLSLGHEVLRSSTAGAAVLSAINYSSGRWS